MILEKIQKLLAYFRENRADEQDIASIGGWEQEANRLFLIKSLKDHDGIKYLLDVFDGEVKKTNDRLQNSYSKELPDSERDRLLDKRDLAQKYLNIFKGVEDDLEKLEESLNVELSKI
jgi:hypothetical protein